MKRETGPAPQLHGNDGLLAPAPGRQSISLEKGRTGGGWGNGDAGGGAISVKVGEALIPPSLWTRPSPEWPPAQLKGILRFAIGATAEQNGKAVEALRCHRILFLDVKHTTPLAFRALVVRQRLFEQLPRLLPMLRES